MKLKLFILIFAMFLLVPFTFAQTVVREDTCDSTENWTSNGASYTVNSGGNGLCSGGGAGFLRYRYPAFNISTGSGVTDNFSISFQQRTSSITNAAYFFNIVNTNNSMNTDGNKQAGLTVSISGILAVSSVGENPCANRLLAGVSTTSNTWYNVSYHILTNASWDIYINGSLRENCGYGAGIDNGTFALWGDNANSYTFDFDNFTIRNLSIAGVGGDIIFPNLNASLNSSTIKISKVVNLSVNVSDETGLSACRFTINQTGSNVIYDKTITGTADRCSQNFTVSLGRGNVINFSVRVNDTSNNLNQSDQIMTVENTNTNASHITNISGLNYNTNITFNWSAGNDPDSDTVYHLVYWSSNNINFYLYSNTTQTNSSSNATSDGTYFYLVNATDYIGDIIGGVVWNFTLDTNMPVLSYNLSNSLFTNKNQTLRITMEDANPFNITMKLYKGNNEYYSKSNQTAFGRFINITIDLNVTEDGNYTIEINASDKHTAKSFPDLETSYINGTLSFISANNPNRGLDLEFAYKAGTGDVQKITTAQISTYNIQKLITNEADRISFGLEADTPPTGQNIKFGFRFLDTSNTKLIAQNENALFHLYSKYWLDFKTYIVNVATGQKTLLQENYLSQNNYHNVYYNITFADYGLSVGDRFQIITESIGGLNLVDEVRNIIYDFTLPVFTDAFNRTADSSNSTSITTTTSVNISVFGIKDLYLESGNFSHNASGSWSNQSISIDGNNTYHYVIGSGNFTVGQVVGWKFYFYDKASNLLDPIYTFSPSAPPSSPPSSSSSSREGGVGGTSIAKCQPYAVQFGACYYYDAINQRCAQGCKQNSICDMKTLVCQPVNTTQISIETTSPTENTRSIWNNIKSWFKGLFNTNAPQLSLNPLSAENEPIKAKNGVVDKATNLIQENIGITLGITGIVVLISAMLTWGIAIVFTNPISLVTIGFFALVIFLITKYNIFGG